MRKGIKILAKVFAAAVLLLIILPLTLSLLLDIPVVQNFVVQKAVEVISRNLETRVSIDRVDIGLFSKVKIKGFYVEDYQRDTLLYVGSLDAFVTSFGILGGGVELSRGEIVGAKLYLRETPEGEMNIKQIVNRISNPDKPKKGNFRLSLNKASIEGMDFCLERLEHRNPEFGIDFGHMHLFDITARVDNFTIDGSTIHTLIEALSARERSGFVLDHFAGRFYLTSGCIGFEEVSILTQRSNVSIPYISLVGNSWAEYKDFIGRVEMNGLLRNTTVSTDDIAYFAPRMKDWHTLFSNVNVEVSGVVSDFTGRIRSLQAGDGTNLAAEATVRGLPDIETTHFDMVISHLSSSGKAIDRLARDIAQKPLPPQVLEIIANAGKVGVDARFVGRLTSFDMQVGATTDVGKVACNLRLKPYARGLQRIWGDVSTRDLRLGRLLGKSDLLGNVTLAAHIDGTVGRGATDANVTASLSRLGFYGYIYDSLRLNGRIHNKGFDGRITARDPNLDFDFFGGIDLNGETPAYDFTLDLHRADLAKLQINRRDSVSMLSGRIEANASGRSVDDLNGRIHVSDACYLYNGKEVITKTMTITGENSAQSKFIQLTSDFANVTFRSRTSYREVVQYLRESAWKYLPLLHRDGRQYNTASSRTAVADEYSLLTVDIRNINPIADAVSAGLQIADGSSLRLLFNPASDKLSLRASSEYIERQQMLATRLNINASNQGDSLALYLSAEDLYAGSLHLPRLSVTGGAKLGVMQLSAGFNDTIRETSGRFGFRAQVVDEHSPNGRVVDLRILPSHLTRSGKTWQISARKILLDTAQVVIDRFYIMNREQELSINGVASRSRSDSVTMRLRNFDLAPFSQAVERMGYTIEGRTNGSATMKSVLREGELTADIQIDSMQINNIAAPPLQLVSRWDFQLNRAGVTVTNRLKRDTLVRGFYNPSQVRYYARLAVDSVDMGLLDPILSGVISNTKGVASADLVLQGRRREANLAGQIRVKGLSTKVDYTQVTYTMPEAVLDVRGNRFRASNVPMFDPQGNRGRFDIDLSLQHLSNISYDVRVAPEQMLVLNTTEADNDVFYGTVYATGRARISGDKGHVNMDIQAASEGNSIFNMPLSEKSNISNADFVTFAVPVKNDTLNDLDRKKLLFERRQRKKSAAASQMDIALALDVRPNLEFQMPIAGSVLRARGEGSLNLQINPRSNVFEMYGDCTITEGSYQLSLQNIITRKFTIENGSTIQWTGSPMDAMLNIEAIHKLKASLQPLLQTSSEGSRGGDRSVPVECAIYLRGRLTAPDITFDVLVPSADPETQSVIANALSTPEMIDTQFLYLLLANSFLAENSASSVNLGASVSAATGLELLSNMLSNWFSNDYLNIMIRYRPKSEVTSDEVDFGLSKSLINNRLLVEVEGNYIVDNKQAVSSSMSNFMGEAYITYLIDRAGTLKFKAFTQTIDRFDENQGLQETGIGFYFKEDFNNFRDFRQRIRDRFTNKKRKARRAARVAEKVAAQQAADTLRRISTVSE